MHDFDKNILQVIEQCSYDFFVIQQQSDVDCICVNYDTKQPNPSCKKCLGTGKKIKIRKVRGASVESGIPETTRPNNDIAITRNYFLDSKYKIHTDNLIIDNEEVYSVYKIQDGRGLGGRVVFHKCFCPVKKTDSKVLLKNFHELIGR